MSHTIEEEIAEEYVSSGVKLKKRISKEYIEKLILDWKSIKQNMAGDEPKNNMILSIQKFD